MLGSDFLREKLVGNVLWNLEVYVGGLTIKTENDTTLNVKNRFWFEGFDEADPIAHPGKPIRAVEVRDKSIAIVAGTLVIHIGSSDSDWSEPEAWSMKGLSSEQVIYTANEIE